MNFSIQSIIQNRKDIIILKSKELIYPIMNRAIIVIAAIMATGIFIISYGGICFLKIPDSNTENEVIYVRSETKPSNIIENIPSLTKSPSSPPETLLRAINTIPISDVLNELTTKLEVLDSVIGKALPKGKNVYGNVFTDKDQEQLKAYIQYVRGFAPNKVKRICEIGFAGGHSAVTLLLASGAPEYIGFDIWDRADYENAAWDHVTNLFPNVKFTLVKGDSTITVPAFKDKYMCDILHVDGAHHAHYPQADLTNMQQLASPENLLFADDCCTSWPAVYKAWESGMKQGYIKEYGRHTTNHMFRRTYKGWCVGFYEKQTNTSTSISTSNEKKAPQETKLTFDSIKSNMISGRVLEIQDPCDSYIVPDIVTKKNITISEYVAFSYKGNCKITQYPSIKGIDVMIYNNQDIDFLQGLDFNTIIVSRKVLSNYEEKIMPLLSNDGKIVIIGENNGDLSSEFKKKYAISSSTVISTSLIIANIKQQKNQYPRKIYDGTTIIMLAHSLKRGVNLDTIAKAYSKYTGIHQIIFIWNNPTILDVPFHHFSNISNAILFGRAKYNSLINRYKIVKYAQTSGILLLDDDIVLSQQGLSCFNKAFNKYPDRVIGVERRHYRMNNNGTYNYILGKSKFSIVIGKLLMFNRKYVDKYVANEKVVKWVDNYKCDDILICAMVSSITKFGPVGLVGNALYTSLDAADGLEFLSNWHTKRDACVNNAAEIFQTPFPFVESTSDFQC